MKPVALKMKYALALVIGGILAAGPVLADKPAWAGAGKGGKDVHVDRRVGNDPTTEKRIHFDERHQVVVREHYDQQFQRGRCPPGLAKKDNGCQPPGQAKKNWTVGQPLPRNTVYYSVPSALVIQFGQPPVGYRYVRVADDILLVRNGTGVVLDAIRTLGH